MKSTNEPRTAREALIAEMLGELDELLRRAEQLPAAIAAADRRIVGSVQVLNEAGDRYRLAVTAFTEEAKLTLVDYLRDKTAESVAVMIEEQRASLQEAVRTTVRRELFQPASNSDIDGKGPVGKAEVSRASDRLEHIATSLLTSLLTAVLVLVIVRLG